MTNEVFDKSDLQKYYDDNGYDICWIAHRIIFSLFNDNYNYCAVV